MTDLQDAYNQAEVDELLTKTEVNKAELTKLQNEADFYRENARFRAVQANGAELEWEQIKASEYENRIYAFDGAVSGGSVQHAIVTLGQWVRRDPETPITIVFNSPGGNVFNGLALFDYIKDMQSQGTQIDTVALGMAASMGGVLLQAGKERTMSEHSYLLIHEVSDFAGGQMSELEDQVKFAKRLQERLLSILAERSTLNKRQIERRWKRRDWWLDADEALKLGFCDRIT
jgi:ATP-dependent Clp endopeptidase proteolytic subunit ClpP